MTYQILSEKLNSAIKHAVNSSNIRLLNRIELELVREMRIKPFPESQSSAYAIGEYGRKLLVLWRDESACECEECDGTGVLYAQGKSKRTSIECPFCDGFGFDEHERDSLEIIVTDIDGSEVVGITANDFKWDDFSYHDPLKEYEAQQKRSSKECEVHP